MNFLVLVDIVIFRKPSWNPFSFMKLCIAGRLWFFGGMANCRKYGLIHNLNATRSRMVLYILQCWID
jgi:hypothetical protein